LRFKLQEDPDVYERVLVPVDGSAFSEEVLPFALGIAQATRAKLKLLRVADGELRHVEATRHVEALAAELGAEGKCLPVSGDVATTISEEVGRIPGTLVAMSSHGRAGILEAVMGSVALKLLRVGHGPILVYRPRGQGSPRGAPAERIESVVLALDGTPLSEAMAPRAAEMARWLSARLVVITVVGARAKSPAGVPVGDTAESSYVRAFANDLGRRYGLQVGWEVLHGDPGHGDTGQHGAAHRVARKCHGGLPAQERGAHPGGLPG
jgi:nucleotide-binding universal stress UspA family protein